MNLTESVLKARRPALLFRFARLVLPALIWGPPLLFACAAENPASQSRGGTGRVELALLRELPSGVRYRLIQANVAFDGPESANINVDGDMEVLRVDLQTGSYLGRLLSGWQMQRQLLGGDFENVEAELTSMQPQNIEVRRGAVTRMALVFDVEGTEVSLNVGAVDIVLEINETARDGGTSESLCGNGNTEPGEECDDGNTANDDGCRNDCTLERCGNGTLDPGEDCDSGGGDSQACSAECRSWELPPLPSDLPDTPLVYVARSNVQTSGARFEGVPYGAQSVLVLGVYPQRPCVGQLASCTTTTHSLGSTQPASQVQGYVMIGEITYPLSIITTGHFSVSNDHGVLLEERFSAGLNWEQIEPEPLRLYVQAGGYTRGNVAGLGSVALPRDLSGFGGMRWDFGIEDINGSSYASAFNAEWTVIDNGPRCGDGVVAPGVETCDDGNLEDGDGCGADCLWDQQAPEIEGYWHSVYGHASRGSGSASWGEPMLLTAGVPAQASCGGNACSYAAQELTFFAGNTGTHQSTSSISVINDSRWDQVRLGSNVAYADAYDGAGTALSDATLPIEDFDLSRFENAYMQADPGGQSVGGYVASWHIAFNDCSSGTCSCTPATCPEEPFCGVFPNGCGGYTQCSCTDSVCLDGICQTP